jgi:hypothetical protein
LKISVPIVNCINSFKEASPKTVLGNPRKLLYPGKPYWLRLKSSRMVFGLDYNAVCCIIVRYGKTTKKLYSKGSSAEDGVFGGP